MEPLVDTETHKEWALTAVKDGPQTVAEMAARGYAPSWTEWACRRAVRSLAAENPPATRYANGRWAITAAGRSRDDGTLAVALGLAATTTAGALADEDGRER